MGDDDTVDHIRLDIQIIQVVDEVSASHPCIEEGPLSVHLDEDGKPQRWKIENSWGSEGVNSGYYIMSDTWFDKYVYQAVVNKKYLGEKAKLYDGKLTVLKPWDPMGTLAD